MSWREIVVEQAASAGHSVSPTYVHITQNLDKVGTTVGSGGGEAASLMHPYTADDDSKRYQVIRASGKSTDINFSDSDYNGISYGHEGGGGFGLFGNSTEEYGGLYNPVGVNITAGTGITVNRMGLISAGVTVNNIALDPLERTEAYTYTDNFLPATFSNDITPPVGATSIDSSAGLSYITNSANHITNDPRYDTYILVSDSGKSRVTPVQGVSEQTALDNPQLAVRYESGFKWVRQDELMSTPAEIGDFIPVDNFGVNNDFVFNAGSNLTVDNWYDLADVYGTSHFQSGSGYATQDPLFGTNQEMQLVIGENVNLNVVGTVTEGGVAYEYDGDITAAINNTGWGTGIKVRGQQSGVSVVQDSIVENLDFKTMFYEHSVETITGDIGQEWINFNNDSFVNVVDIITIVGSIEAGIYNPDIAIPINSNIPNGSNSIFPFLPTSTANDAWIGNLLFAGESTSIESIWDASNQAHLTTYIDTEMWSPVMINAASDGSYRAARERTYNAAIIDNSFTYTMPFNAWWQYHATKLNSGPCIYFNYNNIVQRCKDIRDSEGVNGVNYNTSDSEIEHAVREVFVDYLRVQILDSSDSSITDLMHVQNSMPGGSGTTEDTRFVFNNGGSGIPWLESFKSTNTGDAHTDDNSTVSPNTVHSFCLQRHWNSQDTANGINNQPEVSEYSRPCSMVLKADTSQKKVFFNFPNQGVIPTMAGKNNSGKNALKLPGSSHKMSQRERSLRESLGQL